MKRDREVHLLMFATDSMSRAVELCYLSSIAKGGIGRHFRFTPYDLTRLPYYEEHKALFDAPRGPGYWAWKPALLNRIMGPDSFVFDVMDGDVVIYADAGVEFVNNVSHIIERMDQDIFLFGNNWEHAHWCKRDIVEAIWPDDLYMSPNLTESYHHQLVWRRFGKQCQASVIFIRVSDYSKQFVAEWLKWCLHRERYSTICTDEWRYLIDDSPSIRPNHPEFRENRHDQAILTTLAYREGIKLHYWPASYNDGAFVYEKIGEYTNDDYPIMFNHHRRRNHEWKDAA